MEPITKQQVQELIKYRPFPDFVIQAFNECITESKMKNSSVVKQKDVLKRIVALSGKTAKEVLDNNWLDVEEHYRRAGWKVRHDQPAYNESYDAYFEFS